MSMLRLAVLAALSSVFPLTAQTNLMTCFAAAEPPLLRTENHAERVGDITITCNGGDVNDVRFVNLTVFLDTQMTSDITDTETDETEALLLIDDPKPGVTNTSNGVTYNGHVKGKSGVAPGPPGGPGAAGSGNVYAGIRGPGVTNRITFNGVPVVPAPVGSSRLLRIVNLRGDMTRLVTQPGVPLSVNAFLSASPTNSLPLITSQVVVARVQPGLTALPTTDPGTFTLRFEETFTSAFRKRIENTTSSPITVAAQSTPGKTYFTESGFTPDYTGLDATSPGVADTGTRFVARFTNLPTGAYITAPSNVTSFIPATGPGSLQARRVVDFDASFAGGTLLGDQQRTELVPVASGQATLVYEVIAQVPYEGVNGSTVIDRFDIPVQVIFPQPVSIGNAAVTMGFAPADPTRTFSQPAPEPRFNTYETGTVSHAVRVGPSLSYATFSYVAGDALPLIQDFRLDTRNPARSDSITLLPQTGGNWLGATATSSPTTNTLRLAANPSGLVPGRYFSGVAVRLESSPNDIVVIPAILDVLAPPEILVDTAPLNFQVNAGGPAPAPRIVYLTAKTRALTFNLSTSTTSGGDWLTVSATSNNTPANLSIGVNPSQLSPGTYQGAVIISAANASNSPQRINVTLQVGALGPIFGTSSVVNAASYQGGSIAPGEIVTFFGTGIGPQTPATGQFDANGRLLTLLAGTRIFFGGVPAPLIAVSATQSSAIVPVSAGTLRSVDVQIEVDGVRSQPVNIPVVQSAPGIFTTNAQGTGQGAILNANLSPNSAQNPAARGAVVAIYLTGGGSTSPVSPDGSINDPANLPRITQPVAVTIGGQPATVEYAGGAPGSVAGLYQINARISSAVTPGSAVPVQVTIGNATSHIGVTLAVR